MSAAQQSNDIEEILSLIQQSNGSGKNISKKIKKKLILALKSYFKCFTLASRYSRKYKESYPLPIAIVGDILDFPLNVIGFKQLIRYIKKEEIQKDKERRKKQADVEPDSDEAFFRFLDEKLAELEAETEA